MIGALLVTIEVLETTVVVREMIIYPLEMTGVHETIEGLEITEFQGTIEAHLATTVDRRMIGSHQHETNGAEMIEVHREMIEDTGTTVAVIEAREMTTTIAKSKADWQ